MTMKIMRFVSEGERKRTEGLGRIKTEKVVIDDQEIE